MRQYRIIAFLKKLLGRKKYMEWRNAWLFGREEDPVMLQELPALSLGWPDPGKSEPGPVIIISPTQRSGSNYLHQLVAKHPALVAAGGHDGHPEEFFFHTYGTAVKAYVEKTTAAWSTWIPGEKALSEAGHRLFASIGTGMLSDVMPGVPHEKILLRAPDSRGVSSLFHLFPGARVILLTRDGRDTCASFLDSWGSKSVFEDFTRRWTGRANELIEFEHRAQQSGFESQVLRVRYEECVTTPAEVLSKILPFLGLHNGEYPFDELEKIPLLGTSQNEIVHWNPEKKPDNFNPVGRWKNWPEDEKNTFQQIAGETLRKLGYEV